MAIRMTFNHYDIGSNPVNSILEHKNFCIWRTNISL